MSFPHQPLHRSGVSAIGLAISAIFIPLLPMANSLWTIAGQNRVRIGAKDNRWSAAIFCTCLSTIPLTCKPPPMAAVLIGTGMSGGLVLAFAMPELAEVLSSLGHTSHVTVSLSHILHVMVSLGHTSHIMVSLGHTPHLTVSLGHTPHLTVSLGHTSHVTVSLGHTPHVTVSLGHTPHVTVSLGHTPHVTVSLGHAPYVTVRFAASVPHLREYSPVRKTSYAPLTPVLIPRSWLCQAIPCCWNAHFVLMSCLCHPC